MEWQQIIRVATTLIDPTIWQAYQFGIGLGVVVLTTLILFPGAAQPQVDSEVKPQSQPDARIEQRAKSVSRVSNATKFNASSSSTTRSSSDSSSWTPHRRLNTAVYVVLCTVATVVMILSYSDSSSSTKTASTWTERNPVSLLLKAYFPKEAATLLGHPVKLAKRNKSTSHSQMKQ